MVEARVTPYVVRSCRVDRGGGGEGEDPGWSQLAWGRHYYEEERKLLGSDPWPIGVKTNYSNLERFIGYSHDQNLLNRRITVESLFPEQVLDT